MTPARFVLKKTGAGRYYFVLVGPNGEALMTSESYLQKSEARHEIEGIIAAVSTTATVEDATGDQVNLSGVPSTAAV